MRKNSFINENIRHMSLVVTLKHKNILQDAAERIVSNRDPRNIEYLQRLIHSQRFMKEEDLKIFCILFYELAIGKKKITVWKTKKEFKKTTEVVGEFLFNLFVDFSFN